MFDYTLNSRKNSLVIESEVYDINFNRYAHRLLSDELIFALLETYDIETVKYLIDVDMAVFFYECKEITYWTQRIGLKNIKKVSGTCFEYCIFCHNFSTQIELLVKNIPIKNRNKKPMTDEVIIEILKAYNEAFPKLYEMYLSLYTLGKKQFESNYVENHLTFDENDENFRKFKDFIRVELEKVIYTFKSLDPLHIWKKDNAEIKKLIKILQSQSGSINHTVVTSLSNEKTVEQLLESLNTLSISYNAPATMWAPRLPNPILKTVNIVIDE